jgi:hypothetical protein
MKVRVCPECGEEFRPEIVSCSDCGALLEDRFEGDDAPLVTGASRESGGAPTEGPPAPPAFVRLFRADRAAEIEPLAERLGRAGLPYRVRTAQLGFELLIAEGDREAAYSVLGDALPPDPSSLDDAPFDPESGYAACPACGCRLAPGAPECPECGLGVGAGPEADVCPRCGEARADGGRCESCGPLLD